MYYIRESPRKIVDSVSCHYDMVDMSLKVPSSLDGAMRTAQSVMCLPCVTLASNSQCDTICNRLGKRLAEALSGEGVL